MYNDIDYFKTIDATKWFSRDGKLGRTHLRPRHVRIINEKLTITLPARTVEGGEIQTIDLKGFGSYEISMKLPNAPSSITGFFLYKAPDFYHEIDIEVFNQPNSKVLFTSYAKGAVRNENEQKLNFNPTLNFRRYRIDYYPCHVTFFIDGQPVQKWLTGFTQEPMHLMVNSWFPTWLPEKAPLKDERLIIEWIAF